MAKKTAKEILAEIESLKAVRLKVRRYSTFHDDNHAAIDAQLEVLSKNLSEDEIIDRNLVSYSESSALDARIWMDGDSESESLSDDWDF